MGLATWFFSNDVLDSWLNKLNKMSSKAQASFCAVHALILHRLTRKSSGILEGQKGGINMAVQQRNASRT
jgi:hypothetical protein